MSRSNANRDPRSRRRSNGRLEDSRSTSERNHEVEARRCRKVLTPNDFTDLDEVQQRLAAFERLYEQSAKPFEWKFTRADLAKLMKRLAEKELLLRPAA